MEPSISRTLLQLHDRTFRSASKHHAGCSPYIQAVPTKEAHGMHGTSLSHLADRTAHHRSLTLLTLCLAVLVAQVDTAVVNLAVRPIGEYFSAGVSALQWVVDSDN